MRGTPSRVLRDGDVDVIAGGSSWHYPPTLRGERPARADVESIKGNSMERIENVVSLLKGKNIEVLGTIESTINNYKRVDVLTKEVCVSGTNLLPVIEYSREMCLGMTISTHSINEDSTPRIKFIFVL